MSLGEILSIPQGEMCGAVVGREQGEPAFVVLVEVGDKMPIVHKLLERAEQEAIRNGGSKRTEDVDGVTLTIIRRRKVSCASATVSCWSVRIRD